MLNKRLLDGKIDAKIFINPNIPKELEYKYVIEVFNINQNWAFFIIQKQIEKVSVYQPISKGSSFMNLSEIIAKMSNCKTFDIEFHEFKNKDSGLSILSALEEFNNFEDLKIHDNENKRNQILVEIYNEKLEFNAEDRFQIQIKNENEIKARINQTFSSPDRPDPKLIKQFLAQKRNYLWYRENLYICPFYKPMYMSVSVKNR